MKIASRAQLTGVVISALPILFMLFIAACARPLPDGVTELVYATPYSPGHPFSRADQTWMRFVEDRSEGSLRIRPSWSGALISADQSMTELRHGVIDIGLITPIYVRGGTHLIRSQSGFYSGVDKFEEQVALYRCLAASSAQFDSELEGLRILAVQGGSLPGIVSRDKPISRLSELRGMRIRAPSELLNVLDELGADPVSMPMGDVYSAMAKGVIDGVVAPPDTFRALHFAEIARYFLMLAVPRGAYPARAISEARWNELSLAHRQILDDGIEVWEAALAMETATAADEGLEFATASGVDIRIVSPADQRTFESLYLRHAAQNADALSRFGIDGRRVFDIARASIDADGRISCRAPL